MNTEDVNGLLDYIELLAPKLDLPPSELDRWSILLGDVRSDLETAKEAAKKILQRGPFIDPHEVIAEIKVIREDRLARKPVLEVFGPDDKYRPELYAAIQAIADGRAVNLAMLQIETPAKDGPSQASVEARALAHGWTPEFVRLRDGSMPYPCSYCGASPGEVCLGFDRVPLKMAPAHPPRLEEAGLIEPQIQYTREDWLAFLKDKMAEEATGGTEGSV